MKEYYNQAQWLNYIKHNMSNANIAENACCGIIVTANSGDTLAKFNEEYGYIFESRKLDSGTPFIKERRRASRFLINMY